MKVTFLSTGEMELAETLSSHEEQKPGLGMQFAAQVHAAVERIVAHSEAWAPNHRTLHQGGGCGNSLPHFWWRR